MRALAPWPLLELSQAQGPMLVQTQVPRMVWRQLVREGVLSVSQLIAALTCKPADVLGVERNTGWLLIDPAVTWTVDAETLLSTGKNTPWFGQVMQGRVRRVFN